MFKKFFRNDYAMPFPMYSFLLFAVIPSLIIFAQKKETIKIWQEKPIYSLASVDHERVEQTNNGTSIYYYDVTFASLEYFKPEKPNGTAVIVCPGGGYVRLAYSYEGIATAKWFAKNGISAFVLKYRLPNDSLMEHKEFAPLADAQQAIYYLRKNAGKFRIDPNKIGIIGFSAGGHVASTLSTHFQKSIIKNDEKINLRPDFSILIYPVISMKKEITHSGSKKALLGKNPSDSLVNQFSNELQITHDTPPTFLVHAADDKSVLVENSIRYFQGLKENNIIAAMHVFQKGGHGFAMKNKWNDVQWLFLLEKWLIENKISEQKN